jgi:hypothetical protein
MESMYMLLGNVEFSLRIGGLRAKPSSQGDATPNFTMLLTWNGNKQMGLMQTLLQLSMFLSYVSIVLKKLIQLRRVGVFKPAVNRQAGLSLPYRDETGPFNWNTKLSRIWNLNIVISRRLNFVCRRFGTLCLFHLHRWGGMKNNWVWECWGVCKGHTPTFSTPVILHTYPPMKMEQRECSETLAYKIQKPGNYPEESIQHSEQGESLK